MRPLIPVTTLAVAVLLATASHSAQSQTAAALRRSDAQRPLPLTSFYDTHIPLPSGKPGELIRSEPFDNYDLPYTVSAVRILYHSRSATGEDVASSGVVLYPTAAKPPAGGWPIIAWAHGATGVARACAPSLTRDLGHGPFFSMYVNLGYAIIASDYTGLGTNFPNAFLDGDSNANDVINSVAAARAAVPQLGSRWIVMGEAEGGLTALTISEKENQIPDPGYLGAVVISGFAAAKEIYEAPRGASALPVLLLAHGIQTVYPRFRVSDILKDKALARYHLIEQSCPGTTSELSLDTAVKPGWWNNPFVIQYFARNSPDQRRGHGPILAISADAKSMSPALGPAPTINRLCRIGDKVQWDQYPEPNLGGVLGDSVRDQIAWIEARFAGRGAASNCP